MRNVNIRIALWLLLGLSAVVWIVLGITTGRDLSRPQDLLALLPEVITVVVVFISAFVKWGWRIQLLRGWLVPFPNLNGTWIGQIRSNWTGDGLSPRAPVVPAMLTIRQSFFNISCVVQTAEMRSDSYTEGFRIDEDRQIRELLYTYSSRPRLHLQHRSPRHDGTAVLEVIEAPERKLGGRYWNERRATGELEFVFHCKKMLEELPADSPSHPMAE